MTTPLHYRTISDLAPDLRERKISPVEVTEAMLRRIEELDPKLKAYATITADLAMDQAKEAESEIAQGRYRGPLHGVPIAVKDLCYTKGVRTMGGTAVLADFVPEYDATVVAKFRAAGAVLLGKLNLTEGAMAGYNPKRDIPDNPWKSGHSTGASSSGSGVATAAGLAYATLGSDTGGSIRGPSSMCGVVGLKPTYGRVSRYGVIALAESLDHVGPMTRSAGDAGLVLQAIAGHDPHDPTSLSEPVPEIVQRVGGVSGVRVGWDERYASEDMEPEFANAVRQAVKTLDKLGAEIVEVRMPERLREYLPAWTVICTSEALTAHAAFFPARSAEYGPFFREWLEKGASFTAADYARAHFLRNACAGELRTMLRDVDIFACPPIFQTAPAVTKARLYGPIPPDRDPWHSRFTAPYNFTGLPSLTLPAGVSTEGLPMGVQLVGKALSEPLLVRVGNAFETATPFHTMHPPGW